MNREDAIREVQEKYRLLGRSLNEFERRHWAAMEAMTLGRGGITAVSKALRISPNTIKRGIQEIATGQVDLHSQTNSGIRRPGGGRKSKNASSDRLTQTRSKKDSADSEVERRDCDGSAEHRHVKSPTSNDPQLTQINDTAKAESSNQLDNP